MCNRERVCVRDIENALVFVWKRFNRDWKIYENVHTYVGTYSRRLEWMFMRHRLQCVRVGGGDSEKRQREWMTTDRVKMTSEIEKENRGIKI